MTQEDKLDVKRILPLFVIVLVDLLGLTVIIPLLPLYAVRYEADPLMIGLLSATYPAMQFLAAPLLGRLSDRFGRKPVLIVSQIGTLAGFLILGFANTLAVLFISRFIDGISGANLSTVQAAITDSTTEKTRTQGLGLIGAAFGLGFIIGPLVAFAALALTGNNYRVPAFMAAVFSLSSILLTVFWLEETHPAETRGQQDESAYRRRTMNPRALLDALTIPGVGVLLVIMFVQQFAFGGLEYLLSLFTLDRLGLNASSNALLFIYIGVILVTVQGYFIGKWSKAIGDRRLIHIGLAALAVGLLLTATTPTQPPPWYSEEALRTELEAGSRTERTSIAVSIPDDAQTGPWGLGWLLVAMIPISIGGGMMVPSINSLITKRVPVTEVGGTLGISTSFYSGANAVAPVVSGALFQWFGSTAPFLISGVIVIVMLVVALRVLQPEPSFDVNNDLINAKTPSTH